MDPKDTSQQKNSTPSNLPVFGDKKVEIHTMQSDLNKSQSEIKEKNNSSANDRVKKDASNIDASKREIPVPPKPPGFDPKSLKSEIKKPSPFDKFRKPKDLKSEPISEKIDTVSKFKESLPKKTETVDPSSSNTGINVSSSANEQKNDVLKKAETKSPDLDIKIPTNENKSKIIIVFSSILVVVFGLLGFGYYFVFIKKPNTINTVNNPDTSAQPESEIVRVPDPETTPPVVEEFPVPEDIPAVVEIPEPEEPSSVLNTDRTITTIINTKDTQEALKSLRADSRSIVGDGVLTRHLFKLVNDTENRYITGKEMFDLLGLFVPGVLWGEIGDVDFVSYKINGVLRYGFIAKISGKESIINLVDQWGVQSIDDLRQIYMGEAVVLPEDPKFLINEYLGFDKRYINLPTPETSLDYAVSEEYLIVATSKDMVFAMILKTKE